MCTPHPTPFSTWNNLTYTVLTKLEASQRIYRVPPSTTTPGKLLFVMEVQRKQRGRGHPLCPKSITRMRGNT